MALVSSALVTPAWAGGPILLDTSTGVPVKWDSTRPVLYNIESGRLNANLDNAQASAAIDLAFQKWTSLAGVSLSTTRGAPIALDITEANVGQFLGKTDGLTPIVFDETGRITDQVLGNGASQVVLGFATPDVVAPGTGRITEGFALMNGKAMASETLESILNLMVHELGHMLGVGHSQLNGDTIFDGNAANNATIPVMFPILRSTSPDNRSVLPDPTLDDEVSMGFLYPSATYKSRGGNLSGRILRDGVEVRGANVIARKIGDPLFSAVSWPSGIATLTGAPWEVHLLPPGDYSVEVEAIDPSFTGGSSIGAFDPPPTGIAPEFFQSPGESSDPTADDPKAKSLFTVTAGSTATAIDVELNETAVTLNPGAEAARAVAKSGTLFATSGALPAFQFAIPMGSASALTVSVTSTASVDLYLRNGAQVAEGSGTTIIADASATGAGTSKTILLTRGTTPALKSGTYFIALVNTSGAAATFTVGASFQSPLAATSSSGGNGFGSGCSMRPGRPGQAGDEDLINLGLLALPLGLALALRRRVR